jgi:DNA-binding beta-propeller fold protein YncE
VFKLAIGHGQSASVSDPRDLVLSPDGRRILVSAQGAESGVYDVGTIEQLVALVREDDVVPAVAYSPDGTRVACARSTTDETIIVGVP